MGDFHQHGLITTLHQLNNKSYDQIESDLLQFRKKRPMGLVLPSLFSELRQPALSNIVNELCGVHYLDQIVIGIDQASREDFQYTLDFFNRLPLKPDILWNDGPRLKEIDSKLQNHAR